MSGYLVVETAVYNHRIAGTFDPPFPGSIRHAPQLALRDYFIDGMDQ